MNTRSYRWRDDAGDHQLKVAWVPGTDGRPYPFGRPPAIVPVDVQGYYLDTTPVTQALWLHVTGSNPSERPDPGAPVENVSWEHITGPGGFLERLNAGPVRAAIAGSEPLQFRLPSETEWEYAARGGPHWPDGFVFSGGNDPDAVAWYGPRWGLRHRLISRALAARRGWRLIGRLRLGMKKPTRTHEVAAKAPNQLGLYDMSGNVWEWCQDICTADLNAVPRDGTPYLGPGTERRLRGGCHHNWDLHCTVSWRYGIEPGAHDGCIGFRLALAPQ